MKLSEIIDLIRSIPNFSILYAEDEESVRESMIPILNRFCSDITAVTNGLEAWEAYQKRPFSIVITDLQMPKMNGVELIVKIQAAFYHQPIIIISAFHEDSRINTILDSDTLHLLTKPLVLSDFLSALQLIVANGEISG